MYLESTGVGQESQARRLGCFRLRCVCHKKSLALVQLVVGDRRTDKTFKNQLFYWKLIFTFIFRLAGTLFGGQGVFYQNDEGLTFSIYFD